MLSEHDFAQQINAAKHVTEILRATPPFPRPFKDPNQTVEKIRDRHALGVGKQISMMQTYVTADKHSSAVANLDDLKPICLKDMRVNMVHRGRYLLCRTLMDTCSAVSAQTVVEDENGDVDELNIYNCRRSYDEECKGIIEQGTVLAIKEPFIKLDQSGRNWYIRVDSPTDLVVVNDLKLESRFRGRSSELSYELLKTEGNKFFANKKYHQALRRYQRGLMVKDCPVLHLCCAGAFLGLELYWQAFKAAERCLELLPAETAPNDLNREKALFRMAKAAYGMRQWKDAAELFGKCFELNGHTEAKAWLESSQKRLHESATGEVDLRKLVHDRKAGQVKLDVADFVHQHIAVADIDAKRGKGVLAQHDIKKGTVLVVSKAFGYGYRSDCPDAPSRKVMSIDLIKNVVNRFSTSEELLDIVNKIRGNPHLAKEFFALYAGPSFPRDASFPEGMIDIARVESIQSYNSFGIDLEWFEELSPISKDDQDRAKDSKSMKQASGMWIFPSYFNHSCVANTTRRYIGDVIVITATEDIPAGQEVTVAYECPATPLKERQDKFQKHYGFECHCPLCKIDAKQDLTSKCLEIYDKFREDPRSAPNRVQVAKAEALIQQLRDVYGERQAYRIGLLDPLQYLANVYFTKNRLADSYELLKETLAIAEECNVQLARVALEGFRVFEGAGIIPNAHALLKLAVGSTLAGDRELFLELVKDKNRKIAHHLAKIE